jgi:hypothetical protein
VAAFNALVHFIHTQGPLPSSIVALCAVRRGSGFNDGAFSLVVDSSAHVAALNGLDIAAALTDRLAAGTGAPSFLGTLVVGVEMRLEEKLAELGPLVHGGDREPHHPPHSWAEIRRLRGIIAALEVRIKQLEAYRDQRRRGDRANAHGGDRAIIVAAAALGGCLAFGLSKLAGAIRGAGNDMVGVTEKAGKIAHSIWAEVTNGIRGSLRRATNPLIIGLAAALVFRTVHSVVCPRVAPIVLRVVLRQGLPSREVDAITDAHTTTAHSGSLSIHGLLLFLTTSVFFGGRLPGAFNMGAFSRFVDTVVRGTSGISEVAEWVQEVFVRLIEWVGGTTRLGVPNWANQFMASRARALERLTELDLRASNVATELACGALAPTADVAAQVREFLRELNDIRLSMDQRYQEKHGRRVDQLQRRIEKLALEVTTRAAHTASRSEPVCIALIGKPGVGKSLLINLLSRHLIDKTLQGERRERAMKNPNSEIFMKNAATEYWEGYTLQHITVLDDFGQTVAPKGTSAEFAEIIRLVNVAQAGLNMARAENKGAVGFLSEYVIVNGNDNSFADGHNHIKDAVAFDRRLKLHYEVKLKDEYRKGDFLNLDAFQAAGMEPDAWEFRRRVLVSADRFEWRVEPEPISFSQLASEAVRLHQEHAAYAAFMRDFGVQPHAGDRFRSHLFGPEDLLRVDGPVTMFDVLGVPRSASREALMQARQEFAPLVDPDTCADTDMLRWAPAAGIFDEFIDHLGTYRKWVRGGYSGLTWPQALTAAESPELLTTWQKARQLCQRYRVLIGFVAVATALGLLYTLIRGFIKAIGRLFTGGERQADPSGGDLVVDVVGEAARKVLCNNYRVSHGTSPADAKIFGSVLFVDGQAAIVNGHFAANAEAWAAGETVFFLNPAGDQFHIPAVDFVDTVRRGSPLGDDLVIATFPRARRHANIVSHFADEPKTPSAYNNLWAISLSGGDRPVAAAHSTRGVPDKAVVVRGTGAEWRDLIRTDLCLGVGYCGSLLVGRYANMKSRIVGIYCAGMGDPLATGSCGWFRRVTRVALEQALGTELHGGDRQLPGGWKIIGPAEPPVHMPTHTKLSRTAMCEELGMGTRIPAMLRPTNGIDPVYNMCVPFGAAPVHIDEAELARAVTEYQQHLEHVSPTPPNRPIFGVEEALRGDPDIGVGGLPPSTSAGYPYCAKTSGKQAYLDPADPLGKAFRLELGCVERELRSGGPGPRVYWMMFCKDELREAAKFGKTRPICGASLMYSALWRMYMGAWDEYLKAGRIYNGIAVGINPYADATATANYLTGGGIEHTPVFAGDYTAFDSSHTPQLFAQYIHAANDWYADGPEERRVRAWLLQQMSDPHIVIGHTIATWSRGLPSGHPATSTINSFINILLLRLAYHRLKPPGAPAFDDAVRPLVYGDDNVVGLHRPIATWYNQNTVGPVLATCGYTYTPEDKGDGVCPDTRVLTEVEFLKRRWVSDGAGGCLMPLRLASILSIPRWVRGRDDVPGRVQQNVECALRELSLHPRDVWDEYAELMRSGLVAHYRRYVDATNHEVWRHKCLGTVADDFWSRA